jgi:APA family basic amino acid/polyamine antiporter
MSGVFAAATVALGFAGYFNAITGLPLIPVAAFLVLLLSGLLILGIRETAAFTVIFTLIEAGGLIFLIVVGLPYLGNVDYLAMPHGPAGVFQASALLFFAYTGFEGIVKLSDETRDPERTIPRALLLSLGITIVLYILVALCAVSVSGWELVAGSDAPFAAVVYAALGSDASAAISVIALFATANTALMFLLASSRITYGMAGSGILPGILAAVHTGRRTPWMAILVLSLVTFVVLFIGNISLIANVTNVTLFITFIAINAAVIVLRYRMPDIPRPFRVPGSAGRLVILPLAGIAFSLFLLVQQNAEVLGISAVLLAAGFLVYFLIRKTP